MMLKQEIWESKVYGIKSSTPHWAWRRSSAKKKLTKAELGNKSHTTRKIKIEEKNCEFSDESEVGGKFEFLELRLAQSTI